MTRIAYIGLGANLASKAGPPETTLAAAAHQLDALGKVVARSSLYSTEPVGLREQPRFVNAAVAIETDLEPRGLLEALMLIEHEFGRDRASGVTNGPRTLDLDILLFGDVSIDEPDLHVPHPRLAERAFVLVPLNEIAPSARDPRSGMTVAQLLKRLFLNLHGAHDAIYPIESDIWRAAPGGNLSGSRVP